jgi:hypothetical protein
MSQNSTVNKRSRCANNLNNSYDVPVSNSLSLRVYADTQPHNLKICDLQKGLILVRGVTETVGEGTGFGLPVLVYDDDTYFSGTSRIHFSRRSDHSIIKKEFIIDLMARNRFRNVTLENQKARDLIAFLAHLYQRHPRLRLLTLKGLTKKIDISTAFIRREQRGKVIVTYVITREHISVKADFRYLINDRPKRMFMLNEQGSRFYRRYFDSQGTELKDTSIGAWNTVDAEWAALGAMDNEIGFRLWKAEDSILRRGQEFLKGSLDWVGLDYEIPPNTDFFEYPIEILGENR